MMIQSFSELQQRILEALGTFGYATTQQLLDLWIGSERSYVNKLLKQLRTYFWKPLIYTNHFGVHPKKWKLPSVHCLSIHGAKLLQEQLDWEWETVRYVSVKQKLFKQDYEHRLKTIEIYMRCHTRCQTTPYEIEQYHYYFEKQKKTMDRGTTSLTGFPLWNGKTLIADSLFLLKNKKTKAVFAVEYYNDKTVLRMFKQIEKYVQALSNGYPALVFDIKKNTQVLLVFKYPNVMKLLQERLQQENRFIPFKKLFLFKSLEVINGGVFSDRWSMYDGTEKGF